MNVLEELDAEYRYSITIGKSEGRGISRRITGGRVFEWFCCSLGFEVFLGEVEPTQEEREWAESGKRVTEAIRAMNLPKNKRIAAVVEQQNRSRNSRGEPGKG